MLFIDLMFHCKTHRWGTFIKSPKFAWRTANNQQKLSFVCCFLACSLIQQDFSFSSLSGAFSSRQILDELREENLGLSNSPPKKTGKGFEKQAIITRRWQVTRKLFNRFSCPVPREHRDCKFITVGHLSPLISHKKMSLNKSFESDKSNFNCRIFYPLAVRKPCKIQSKHFADRFK